MKNDENGDKTLDYILKNTVQTIENSKSQIFDIYESARAEVEGSKENLVKVKQETEKIIRTVDELEKIEQQEKRKLVLVSGNFTNYSEERIKATYESVKNIQVKLGIAREKEHQLRMQRNKIELQLKNLKGTLGKAERLAMRISSVLGYLSSHISDVVAQMQNASKSKFVGAQIIKAQEDERLRVSREIHDGPAQGMAQLIYQATICERMIDINKEEAKWNLQQLRHQIRGCISDIRQVIFDMRPMSLDDLGLVPAVQQLLLKLKDRGILDATLKVEGNELSLDKYVEVSIFRIIQEALNNVQHHAETKKAKVCLLYSESHLSLLVVDAGKGFAADEEEDIDAGIDEDAEEHEHFGILGMKERASIIGAELSVVSVPNRGTRVHLRLPWKEPSKTEKVKPGNAAATEKKEEAEGSGTRD